MNFVSALFAVVAFIAELFSIYNFIESRGGTKTRTYSILGMVGAGMLLGALLLANLPATSGAYGSRNTTPPTSDTQPQATSVTPVQTRPTQPPTPTPKPCCGTVLYQADQSWSGWSGPSWNVNSNGFLTNDGTNNSVSTDPTIIAPVSLQGISDYAVEMKMQLITTLDPTVTYGNYPCFNILVRGNSTSQGWQGYEAGFYCFYPPYNAWIKGAQDDGSFTPSSHAPFDPGHSWHTYRVEVKGSEIRFLIDGGLKVDMTDLRYPSGGQVGLECFILQLEISSFKIIAL